MATKYPLDDTSAEILDLVKWQIYVLTDNSMKLIGNGETITLPDLAIFCQYFKEGNTFFVSNLTLKELNKPIVIHWGETLFPQEEIITEAREVQQVPNIGNIHVEFDLDEFIMINPRTVQELEAIHNMLTIDHIYYMDGDPEIIELLSTLSQVSDSCIQTNNYTSLRWIIMRNIKTNVVLGYNLVPNLAHLTYRRMLHGIICLWTPLSLPLTV